MVFPHISMFYKRKRVRGVGEREREGGREECEKRVRKESEKRESVKRESKKRERVRKERVRKERVRKRE